MLDSQCGFLAERVDDAGGADGVESVCGVQAVQ